MKFGYEVVRYAWVSSFGFSIENVFSIENIIHHFHYNVFSISVLTI